MYKALLVLRMRPEPMRNFFFFFRNRPGLYYSCIFHCSMSSCLIKNTKIFKAYFPLKTAGHQDSSAPIDIRMTREASNFHVINKNFDVSSTYFHADIVPSSALKNSI